MKAFVTRIALPVALCSFIWIGCNDSAVVDSGSAASSSLSKQGDLTGNGGPSGPHYNLNLIATKDKNVNLTGGNGHRIFVQLGNDEVSKRTKINLCNSSDDTGECYGVGFEVLDANGTDGEAEFALPDPCEGDNDDPTFECTSTEYSVWARALGKPGLMASLQTCAEDEFGNEYCSADGAIDFTSHGNKPPKFGDVSRYLLTLYLDFYVSDSDTEALGECLTGSDLSGGEHITKRVGLFNSCLENYFWYYDNSGLRILQLRFYPDVPSNLP